MKNPLTVFCIWLAGVLGLLSYFLYSPSQWLAIKSTPITLILGLSLLVLATWLIVYCQNYLTIRSITKPPPFFEYLGVFFISMLINYSPIRIGIAARAAYLLKRHNIPIAIFSAISSFRLLVFLFISSLVATIALAAQTRILSILVSPLYLIFLTTLSLPIAIFIISRLSIWERLPYFFKKHLGQFSNAFTSVQDKHDLTLALCIMMIVQFLLVAIRMKICFHYSNLNVDLLGLMVVAPLGAILSVISITPGGIGIREYAVATACALLGYSFEQGMQALILDRISMIIIAFSFGFGSFPFVLPNKTKPA